MNNEQMNLKKQAFKFYNLSQDEMISKKVLEYARLRLVENKDLFEDLIKICGEEITFDDLLTVFDESAKDELYKKEKKLSRINDNYYVSVYTVSEGNVAVEVSSTLEALKYFIEAIKSRNSVTISDLDYLENEIKNCLLLIFKNALEKFGLDSNLIDVEPFEECYYENFDKIIVLDENRVVSNKEVSDSLFIYLEDNNLESAAYKDMLKFEVKGIKVHLLRGDIDEAIDRINRKHYKAASIYTKNGEAAYKFINLTSADNVFVNASLEYAENVDKCENDIYQKKRIIYPVR